MTATAHAATASGAAGTPAPNAPLVIDYWTVVMGEETSCSSCDETLTVLNGAIDTIRPLADQLGITVKITPRTVSTWDQALEHRITASPTMRAEGIELCPSHPDGTETRRWTWRSETTNSLQPQAALDFVLQALCARSRQLGDYLSRGGPSLYLRRFLSAPVTPEHGQATSCGAGGTCS
ncbi:MAG: hypothetical protein M0026_00825 [Nocardiopsaceae bacterium]|nr:hypothetical protein [Nocardiopsaceae bacterium]